MLQENTSHESLSIESWNAYSSNSTPHTLSLYYPNGCLRLTDDESKQMAAFLKKIHALESLPDIDLENGAGNVGAILRLNGAGCRYFVEAVSSISKGVEVISAVSPEIH